MSIFKTAVTSAAVLAGGLAAAPQQAQAGGHVHLGSYGLYAPSGYGFGNGYGGTNLYGNSYYGGYGGYYGGGYGGYSPYGGAGYGGTAVYHDTSHFDYTPGMVVPHGNHAHYIPGHLQYHPTGHYDIYGPGHFGGY